MNADRRKRIAKLQEQLQAIKEEFETIQGEEQDAFDNLPEGLQGGERGQAIEEAAGNLQEIVDQLDQTLDDLSNVVDL